VNTEMNIRGPKMFGHSWICEQMVASQDVLGSKELAS
jgi:hypothetical protein